MPSCSRMAAWAGLISVRWRKVPAGPVKVPTAIRSSWRRSSGQVPPVAFSGDAQVAVQARLGGDDAAQLGPLVLAEGVGAVDEFFELGDHAGADRGVPL